MAGMSLIGPQDRAKQARAAVNRLRWEVDYALGTALGVSENPKERLWTPRDVNDITVAAIAEGIAIYRRILLAVDEQLPDQRDRVRSMLLYYDDYHDVGR